MPKILIVNRVLPSLSEKLTAEGYECITNREITHDEFVAMPDEYDGLIIRFKC